MNLLGQSALLLGVTSFSFGFAVLARNFKNFLFISFFLLTLVISGWSLGFFFHQIWPDFLFYRVHLAFNVLLTPVALQFMTILAQVRTVFSTRFFWLSVLLSFCFLLSLSLHWDEKMWILKAAISFFPIGIFFQILWLIGYSRSQFLQVSGWNFRKYGVYSGALILLFLCVMDHVSWMGKTVPALGNLGLIGYLFFLSQLITQQRLLNFYALFSRFIVLLVVAFILALFYALLVAWVEESSSLFFLNSFIASFVILMVLDPLRSMVGYFTQILLTQKHRRLNQSLKEFQTKLTRVLDFSSLFQLVVQTTEQILRPEWIALFVLRQKNGYRFRRIRASGMEVKSEIPEIRELLARNPLVVECEALAKKGKLPILFDQMIENERDRSTSRSQRAQSTQLLEHLKALNANLLIPLIESEKKVLGFLILRMPPTLQFSYQWAWLPTLYPYYEKVADWMQNTESFTKQREKERLALLGQMAAGLAHEIRNPLGSIKGAAQYLDPSVERPESPFLKVIIEEVDRLNRVVSQFLDYSKPHATERVFKDLNQVVTEFMPVLQSGLREGLSLQLKVSRQPAWVQISQEQIRQVMMNFIQNAQRAYEGFSVGKIEIAIEIQKDGDLGEVVLSVEDHAKGIKKENLEKLFIPFFTTFTGGTGLGLSISQKMVEAHGGRIEVLSEEGRWTQFFLILPYRPQGGG